VPLNHSLQGERDAYLFREGTHSRLYDLLGCHPQEEGGAHFAVWAPNAESVSVVGDWNYWSGDADPLQPSPDGTGIWRGHVPHAAIGHAYKYRIRSRHGGYTVDKADPVAFSAEPPPATASRICELSYKWGDAEWMANRGPFNALDAPQSVYEVHLGSWRRKDGQFLGYRETGAPAGRLRDEDGFHPCGAHAGDRASVLRLVGLPDHRLLRAHFALRFAAGLHVPRGPPAPAGHRRAAGLGALALSDRRARPGLFRRHASLRACRSAPGFPPGVGSSIFNYERPEVRSFLVSSRCSGWTAITWMACGWTRSPRCSTSTTRASTASGFPTATAAARTWRPSTSCRR
jgi:1,4-alpha-glucan branching enzyme